MTMPNVILASGSPRRDHILRAHNVKPTIILPQVDESRATANVSEEALRPADLVVELAVRKATDVFERFVAGGVFCKSCRPTVGLPALIQKSVVLAADTVVYKEGEGILGKPQGRVDAIRMLELLRNTEHQVYTGVALIRTADGETATLCDVSTVRFGDYSPEDIEEYLEVEPPFDKAGSYGAQGLWQQHIVSINGDAENVIGLPWRRIEPLLQKMAKERLS
jgi:septum formation protein